ncbi:tetratricopeptide repeat protein [Actinokineospora sp. UTMC 2448]|uniref:tetratricopeptide repeat protein n=1 Tax=Actinokineospora sp. UTMC 2448 TaxID=2268449 RepID=UPI0022036936|nr:tetratricopeptide repeat protein [Actinokineospora sp. UTMC 2448]UVS77530.1 putative PEP-CTERM system TPR-repeat lipoprotein [Actinokineospora sp. UTMC 2448]
MSQPIDAVLADAARLTAAGRPRAAIEVLRPVLADHPDHPGAWCGLAAAFLDVGEPLHCLDAAKRAITLGEPAWAHRLASLALTELGRHEEAVISARESARRDPDDWRGQVALAEALAPTTPADALTAARRAVAIAPEEPRTHEVLGNTAERAGDLDGARAAYQESLRLDPTNPDAQAALSRLRRTTGRFGDVPWERSTAWHEAEDPDWTLVDADPARARKSPRGPKRPAAARAVRLAPDLDDAAVHAHAAPVDLSDHLPHPPADDLDVDPTHPDADPTHPDADPTHPDRTAWTPRPKQAPQDDGDRPDGDRTAAVPNPDPTGDREPATARPDLFPTEGERRKRGLFARIRSRHPRPAPKPDLFAGLTEEPRPRRPRPTRDSRPAPFAGSAATQAEDDGSKPARFPHAGAAGTTRDWTKPTRPARGDSTGDDRPEPDPFAEGGSVGVEGDHDAPGRFARGGSVGAERDGAEADRFARRDSTGDDRFEPGRFARGGSAGAEREADRSAHGDAGGDDRFEPGPFAVGGEGDQGPARFARGGSVGTDRDGAEADRFGRGDAGGDRFGPGRFARGGSVGAERDGVEADRFGRGDAGGDRFEPGRFARGGSAGAEREADRFGGGGSGGAGGGVGSGWGKGDREAELFARGTGRRAGEQEPDLFVRGGRVRGGGGRAAVGQQGRTVGAGGAREARPLRDRRFGRAQRIGLWLALRRGAGWLLAGGLVLMIAGMPSPSRLLVWFGVALLVLVAGVVGVAVFRLPADIRVTPGYLWGQDRLMAVCAAVLALGLGLLAVWTAALGLGATGMALLTPVVILGLLAFAVGTLGLWRMRIRR